MDERAHATCCQFADDEQLQYEGHLFDCDTCSVATAVEGLYPENVAAWRFFQRLCSRFVVDSGLVSTVFTRETADLDSETVDDVLERLAVIYDDVMPMQKPQE